MKRVFISLIVGVFALGAGIASAESEVDAWYLSKSDEYMVRDSINGNLHATMSTSKAGTPYVYIFMHDSDCEKDDGNITTHNPLKINGVLTRYNQYCDGSRRYFLPATDAGREHLINEFKKRNFVEVATHDDSFRSLFSAKGFTDIYNKVVLRRSGI